MTRLTPSEAELHAFVDDQLPAKRRDEVQAWLAAHPADAERVDAWRRDARRLRTALAGYGDDLAPTLDLSHVRRRVRQRRQRRWTTAAGLVLALGLGGLGGWQARDAAWMAAVRPMADAVQAHRLFADAAGLDVQVSDPQQLQAWLGRHFNRVGQLPDLTAYGLRPVGARLLANEMGPAGLLVFEDADGERISLFVRSPGSRYNMPDGQRLEGTLEARYWSHGAYAFAVVSPAADTRAAQVRQALGVAL